jgi:hypothetical protein
MEVTVWAVIGVVAALVLLAGVVIGIRRPRYAEDELSQPKPRPAAIDARDSADLLALLKVALQSIEARRGTGTLQLTAGERTGSMYFLFGHLFHAATDALSGEPAVHEMLSWQDVRYTFDTKATLPTEETIERPLAEILAG